MTELVLTAEQITKRQPVWCALAELFLDTELEPADIGRLAETLFRAGISVRDAERILNKEVAPVFVVNLLSVAGEWSGWPETVVRERVLAHLSSSPVKRKAANLCARTHRELYAESWNRVATQLALREQAIVGK